MDTMVRQALLTDARAIARVHVLTWQSGYRGLVPDELLAGLSIDQRTQMWRRLLEEENPAHPIWVADINRGVVGFVDAGPSRDEDAGDSIGEIFAFYVLPEHQGVGVGRSLIATASSWLAEQFEAATLWVLKGNTRTRRFYELSGWRFDGSIKDQAWGPFVLREARYRIDFRKPVLQATQR